MPKIPVLDGDRKVAVSLSTLYKLLAAVLAIGIAYATATSRLELIETGINKGIEAQAKTNRRLDALEYDVAAREAATNDTFHTFDLRLQSIEERVFGESRSAKMRGSVAPRQSPNGGSMTVMNAPLPPNPNEEERPEVVVSDRRKQWRELRF